ncbi:MAG: MFS transporter [Carboxylicivirga sp.]|jgi:PAT family beta-lactamase induction signal transducer AmpG|nr:MFS transporter [Carboxylicivirga sp.]MCT4645784.1 MFS transporter [Carboxylicivirga sp.]
MNNTKQTHPAFWIPSVYFAMGLPFALVTMASVLMYEDLGVSDTQITFWTALITLPWTLKPLWSPLLEMFKTKKHFVLATQWLTGISLMFVAFSLQLPSFFQYSIAFFAILAFSGATHDIATDGVYINALSSSDQAKYIGWQGAAYNIAKFLSMSGFAYLAGELSKTMGPATAWMWAMASCGGLMIVLGFYHLKMLPSGGSSTHVVTSLEDGFNTLWEVIRTFFQKKFIIWHIAFIILYRFAEGLALKIVPLFLKAPIAEGGLGFDTSTVASVYGAGSVSFVLGSLLGGHFISKRGLKRSLMYLALAFNIPFVCYFLLSLFRPEDIMWVYASVLTEWFGYGFGFVGLMLFMMQQVAPGKYKMAHYAFASGIMNLGIIPSGMVSGWMSDWLGYKLFFIWVLVATIPALLVTKFVPFVYKEETK